MNYQAIANELEGLANGSIDPMNDCVGICYHIKDVFGEDERDLVTGLSQGWLAGTGLKSYPVPHPTLTAPEAFSRLADLWADDAYGDNRRDLCLFLSKEFHKLVK